MTDPVLSVRNLTIEVMTATGPARAVENVSFDVARGEAFGVVGESGSGKSLTMLAIMGLLPVGQVRVTAGEILLEGRNLLNLSFDELRAFRGKQVSMVFQDPMTSFNPVIPMGAQIGEIVRIHQPAATADEVRRRVVDLLDLVGVPDPERCYRQYPHEFSGGMRQRAMIAMAVANDPALLIADEPTTALDVTIQAQVMAVLAKARQRTQASMILVTHDLGLVAESVDRIAVMYGGRILETGGVDAIFEAPGHPYTVGLLKSLPRFDRAVDTLHAIPGQPAMVGNRPSGCLFHPRCGLGEGRVDCRARMPELLNATPAHWVACHARGETARWATRIDVDLRQRASALDRAVPGFSESQPLLQVENLHTHFRVARSRGWGREVLRAVNGVSFAIDRRQTFGLVGESGCGKSTLGRTLLGLHRATGGRVVLAGRDVAQMNRSRSRDLRRMMQVVFQDPYASLDPRMDIHDIVAEPLMINEMRDDARVRELMDRVGLPADAARRKPAEFSGGQRQRIAIARALALNPELIILDEAVSSLDVSIQAQVINLLKQLQQEFGIAYLFISHNLAVVRHVSDRVAVMYLGRIVEVGPSDLVFNDPRHPYTKALLAAVPVPDARRTRTKFVLTGDIPNPVRPPSGCAFRTRCALAQPSCARAVPELTAQGHPEHFAACFVAASNTPIRT